MSGLEILK